MKAIETEYNGILFRSRLEARWAILFDALKIEWVYEPDCFILSNGQKYTPDFYIPKYKLYIEVKPNDWWQNVEYHINRYRLFEADLLILSDEYPDFRVNKLFSNHDELGRIENDVVFIPNHRKYGYFYFSGYDLGSAEDDFADDYKEELKAVKQYRFYK